MLPLLSSSTEDIMLYFLPLPIFVIESKSYPRKNKSYSPRIFFSDIAHPNELGPYSTVFPARDGRKNATMPCLSKRNTTRTRYLTKTCFLSFSKYFQDAATLNLCGAWQWARCPSFHCLWLIVSFLALYLMLLA